MFSTSFRESAGSAWASNAPECAPSHSARSTPIVEPYSRSTGPASQSSKTSAASTQIDWLGSAPLMSSAAASPASRGASPASARARMTTATSGRKCFELCHSRDPLGCFVKMLLVSSRWHSTICSLSWKASATPRGRLLFQLAASEPHTAEIGCGSSQSFPLQKRMWPTPAARDYRYPNARPFRERGGGKRGEQLPNAIGGALNPTWVEWLMGYPTEWTALAPSEMPSSRRFPRSSGEQSCPKCPPASESDKADTRKQQPVDI